MLQIIAQVNGFNLVTTDTVTGNVTISLSGVPWDQALDIILKTKVRDIPVKLEHKTRPYIEQMMRLEPEGMPVRSIGVQNAFMELAKLQDEIENPGPTSK